MSEDKKKRNTTNFCLAVLFRCIYNLRLLKHFGIQRFDIAQKSLWISCHLSTENYTWRLDIVQNNFVVWYLSQNIYYKIFKAI